MKISIENKVSSHKGVLVVPVFEENLQKNDPARPKFVNDFLRERVKLSEFKAKKGEMLLAYSTEKSLPDKILVVGFGKEKSFKDKVARELGAKISHTVSGHKVTQASVMFSGELVKNSEAFFQGFILKQYKFRKFKSVDKKNLEQELEKLKIITDDKFKNEVAAGLKRAEIVCGGVALVKDLVNSPSDVVHAQYMANEAKKIAKENKYKLAVLGTKELTKLGCGGILGVNRGSINEAKLIVLQYEGAKDKKEKPIVIVGKGVIFDTGGYNLKPTGSIETMHQDMAGAATVIGLFSILKKLGIQKNVIGITPVAENLVSAEAFRPSDILKMMNGKTVEITNTDAEGRLILADAITYGLKMNPQAVITIATLTGAVAVALGDRYAGLIGNNVKLRAKLKKAGVEVDELGWPLPLHKDFKKKFNSDVADIRNCDIPSSRYAGSSKGAAFLEKFVEDKKWCHIDIGGTAFTTDPQEFQTKGATAHGLRMLLRFLES